METGMKNYIIIGLAYINLCFFAVAVFVGFLLALPALVVVVPAVHIKEILDNWAREARHSLEKSKKQQDETPARELTWIQWFKRV